MKETRSRGLAALLAALALLAWVAALFFAQRAADFSAGVSVRWTGEGAGVSPAQLLQAERWAREDGRENPPAATLWQEKADRSVTDETGERSAAATHLECYGDAAEFYPETLLAGSYPSREDAAGCIIDEAVASGIWGSASVVGQRLKLDGRTYSVRGVFKGDSGLILTQGEGDSAQTYGNLLLRLPDGGGETEARAWLSQNGFSGGEVLDLPFLSWCLGALSCLPALLLGLGLLLRVLRRGWRLKYSPVLLAQYIPIGIAFGALALWGMGFPWDLPDKVIPTRWSDFDFWSRLAGQASASLRAVFTSALSARDLAIWPAFLACVLTTAAACALVILAAERVRVDSGGTLLAAGLGAMVATFLLAAAFSAAGGVELTRSVWVLPLIWLAADGALRVHERRLRPRTEERSECREALPEAVRETSLGGE